MKKYKNLAQELFESGFNIYGNGNFDIDADEVAIILEILDEKNEEFRKLKLKAFYDKLAKERLG